MVRFAAPRGLTPWDPQRELWRRVMTRFGGGPFDESVKVLGRTLRLRTGSFRHTPDYDDAWFLACAMRSRVIFDVGANIGYDAVLALAFSNVEIVALIEANPEALSVAERNLALNGLTERARFVPGFAERPCRRQRHVLDDRVG